jgi:antitoxin PrlF
MKSSLTTKGQTTVPKEVRDYLKLKPGASIKWFVHPLGHVEIRPTVPISALKGMLKYSGPPVSIEDMDPANFGQLRTKHRTARAK